MGQEGNSCGVFAELSRLGLGGEALVKNQERPVPKDRPRVFRAFYVFRTACFCSESSCVAIRSDSAKSLSGFHLQEA